MTTTTTATATAIQAFNILRNFAKDLNLKKSTINPLRGWVEDGLVCRQSWTPLSGWEIARLERQAANEHQSQLFIDRSWVVRPSLHSYLYESVEDFFPQWQESFPTVTELDHAIQSFLDWLEEEAIEDEEEIEAPPYGFIQLNEDED